MTVFWRCEMHSHLFLSVYPETYRELDKPDQQNKEKWSHQSSQLRIC
jgi:hypothetical protein